MEQSIKVSRKNAKSILALTFPNYTGRKIAVRIVSQVPIHNTNWDGGSKNEYAALRYDGVSAMLPDYAPWNNPVEGSEIELPTGRMIVEHSFFCGSQGGITIYVNPADAPKWLTA
jgi:hypothetical protein